MLEILNLTAEPIYFGLSEVDLRTKGRVVEAGAFVEDSSISEGDEVFAITSGGVAAATVTFDDLPGGVVRITVRPLEEAA